jgi:hypothetical protein
MSETSVPSSLASVNEALKTFIVFILPKRILRISLAEPPAPGAKSTRYDTAPDRPKSNVCTSGRRVRMPGI